MSSDKLPEDVQDVKDIEQDLIPTRRIRFLAIQPNNFLEMFNKGVVVAKKIKVIDGVPSDAKVVSMTIDHVRDGGVIILVVESAEYEEIPMNVMPPVQYVKIKLGDAQATKKKKK